MPEGDTVARQCRILDDALAGAVLTGCDVRVPREATTDLVGWTVAEVRPRGKHLLLRLAPPAPGTPPLTLHSHLMMDGIWHVDGKSLRSSDTSAGPRFPDTIRIVLEARHEDGREVRAVAYDVKQVRVLRTADEEQLLGSLGPDLLDPVWGEDPSLREPRRRAGAPARARAAGSARPGWDREHLPQRAVLPAPDPPRRAGLRRTGSRGARRPRPSPARAEPGPGGAGHDRRDARPGRGPVGVRPRREAVPPLPHPDRARRARRAAARGNRGAGAVVLPAMPGRARGPAGDRTSGTQVIGASVLHEDEHGAANSCATDQVVASPSELLSDAVSWSRCPTRSSSAGRS